MSLKSLTGSVFIIVSDFQGLSWAKVWPYGYSSPFGSHAGVDYGCIIKIRWQVGGGESSGNVQESLLLYPRSMPSLSQPDTTCVVFCCRQLWNIWSYSCVHQRGFDRRVKIDLKDVYRETLVDDVCLMPPQFDSLLWSTLHPTLVKIFWFSLKKSRN